jgi:adenosylmethionine-8-amino-7-oxononanoate aminotransferase
MSITKEEELLKLDEAHVWHPYAAIPAVPSPYVVERCQGCEIHLADGTRLIDGMSSWWACIHGYNHPVLNQAVKAQLGDMSHVMFGGLTHQPAVELATLLTNITPDPLRHVFYSDSGSVAVEVAMKMAIQYWICQGQQPNKRRFLTVKGGYHGDTWACMSVSDSGMHDVVGAALQQQYFADRPGPAFGQEWNDSYLDSMRRLLGEHSDQIAAVILEPIVQGAGGMRFYDPEYLIRVRLLCDQYNVLLIADEIATGFGRTGELFACDWANVSPDIMCLGKALTGGYVSLAATLTTSRIAETLSRNPPGVLMHGPTFMGNPLATAVATASTKLLLSSDWQTKVRTIQKQLQEELEPAKDSPHIQDVRVLGAIGVVEFKESVDMRQIQPALVEEHGVWLRPFGKLLYTMPPFITERHQLRKITTAMVALSRRKWR